MSPGQCVTYVPGLYTSGTPIVARFSTPHLSGRSVGTPLRMYMLAIECAIRDRSPVVGGRGGSLVPQAVRGANRPYESYAGGMAAAGPVETW